MAQDTNVVQSFASRVYVTGEVAYLLAQDTISEYSYGASVAGCLPGPTERPSMDR
jgi:hypothetical protein